MRETQKDPLWYGQKLAAHGPFFFSLVAELDVVR